MPAFAEEIVVVLVTTPAAFDAKAFATTLVEDRVAACVNIVPKIQSVYRWDGATCVDEESLCVIKTRHDRIDALRDRVHALHPADVPEFIVVDVDAASPAYRDWVLANAAPAR